MKKGIIVLGLLVGSTLLLTANVQDNIDRQRQNVVTAEDCTLEGDEVGKGYLDEERRTYKNRDTSSRSTMSGKRQNHVDPDDSDNKNNRRGRNSNS